MLHKKKGINLKGIINNIKTTQIGIINDDWNHQ
jgi:hypothetical protein